MEHDLVRQNQHDRCHGRWAGPEDPGGADIGLLGKRAVLDSLCLQQPRSELKRIVLHRLGHTKVIG